MRSGEDLAPGVATPANGSLANVNSGAFNLNDMDTSTPVLLLGGRENTLSLTRSFGKRGITVRVSAIADCWGLNSKYCTEGFCIPAGADPAGYWADLLLSNQNRHLHGHLIITCNDDAIEFVARNRDKLESLFVLPHGKADLQLALLDKLQTLVLAQQANVPTPSFWDVQGPQDLEALRGSVRFPAMIKPILSHEFVKAFGCKLFIIESDFDELVRKANQAWQANQPIVIVEKIPGPDAALSSYYTYITPQGELLFDYTKCVLRSYPVGRGAGSFHQSRWLPETAEAGKKFFKGIGLTGFGNIEFKRDPRDNVLKVIECNARFTAAQELILQSGAPLDLIVYCAATNQRCPQFSAYNTDLRLWYGVRDFLSFLELYRKREMGLLEWIKSVYPFRNVSALHRLSDPYPTVAAIFSRLSGLFHTR